MRVKTDRWCRHLALALNLRRLVRPLRATRSLGLPSQLVMHKQPDVLGTLGSPLSVPAPWHVVSHAGGLSCLGTP